MRRLLVITSLLLATAVPAASAASSPGATSPGDKVAIRKLQARVRTLSSQLGALSGRVAALSRENDQLRQAGAQTRSVVDRLGATNFCGFALTFDAIYLLMYNDDLLFSALGAGRIYGPQTGVDDQGACAAIGVTRTPWAPRYLSSAAPGLTALIAPRPVLAGPRRLSR
jgi:hypothetical protein